MQDAQVIFNNYDLTSLVGLMVYEHDFNGLPKKDIKEFKLSRKNLSIITSAEYVDKDVSVSMLIKKCSRGQSEIVLKNLKSLLQQKNGSLQVLQAGDTVQYIATLNSLSYSWVGNNLDLTLGFVCSDPLGKNVQETALANLEIIVANKLVPMQIDGSANVEPLIGLTVTGVTGGTGQSVSLLNSITGQGIVITRDWVAGDTLEVDCENETVSINGQYIDFSGIFPIFAVGNQSLQYIDTFTTRDVNLIVSYHKRYS